MVQSGRSRLVPALIAAVFLISPLTLSAQDVDSTRKVPTYEEIQREYELVEQARSDTANLDLDTPEDEQSIGLGGLLINETRSPIGSRFYQVFATQWDPPEQLGSFTLVVREQPTPGLGSLLSILLDEELVFRTRLGPMGRSTTNAAERAVQVVLRRMAEQSNNPASDLFPPSSP